MLPTLGSYKSCTFPRVLVFLAFMNEPLPMISSKAGPLQGRITVPGDKSISHRALILGSLAIGKTTVKGLLEGDDVLATAAAMQALGATIERNKNGVWAIHGAGLGTLLEPGSVLDMGNSGTAARLLIGLVAGHPITATFTGDSSLVKRPMKRIMQPLSLMGATFSARSGGRMPLTVTGPDDTLAIEYKTPVASAQVKSAILLAGLNARGRTSVIEETPTRDYTEKMLRAFGVDVEIEDLQDGAQAIHITGQQELKPCAINVPADPSSAAFPLVAALLVPGSDITLENVGMNPRRTGLFETLIAMGADISYANEHEETGEPVADIRVKYNGALKGIEVPASRVPSMIDEFPILAVAASCAAGTTKMTGLGELRVKESDRLAMMARGLEACGVSLEEGPESLTIQGQGGGCAGGARIETAMDHRIAMSFLVLGGISDEPVTIDDGSHINTSFPGFAALMNELGCSIESSNVENIHDRSA